MSHWGGIELTLYTSCFLSVVMEAPVGFPPLGMVYRTLGAVLLGLWTSSGSQRDRISFRADGIMPRWSLGTFIKLQPRGWSCGGGSHVRLEEWSAWICPPELNDVISPQRVCQNMSGRPGERCHPGWPASQTPKTGGGVSEEREGQERGWGHQGLSDTLQSPSWLPVVTHMSICPFSGLRLAVGGLWRFFCRFFIHASSSGILDESRKTVLSSSSSRFYMKRFIVTASHWGLLPTGSRVLQGPLHRRFTESNLLPILQLNGGWPEGECVGVGGSSCQRDEGGRRALLQLGFAGLDAKKTRKKHKIIIMLKDFFLKIKKKHLQTAGVETQKLITFAGNNK